MNDDEIFTTRRYEPPTPAAPADSNVIKVDVANDEAPPPLSPDDYGDPPIDEADSNAFDSEETDLERPIIDAPALARRPPTAPDGEGVSIDDFHAYMPAHTYIFAPTREMWPAASVNARIPPINVGVGEAGKPKFISASTWLDQNKPVEQMTWAPGEPTLIRDRLITDGGWTDRKGLSTFNLYRPPTIERGDASLAGPWLDHVQRVYPDETDHITKWLAHRVQRPEEKVNHALVFGGEQGVGKDTLLEPAKRAVGGWNFAEASPTQVLGRFNGFLKSVILRISEARDLGDVDRFAFYDHTKSYIASPPDVLRVDEKHLREHSIINCVGIIITTNHKTDGIFLPPDDRRHFVAWTNLTKEEFDASYWSSLWNWYGAGGFGHVAAYLRKLDISEFDPKAPPPKTPAFWDIVSANRAPEEGDLADALDQLGNPAAVTIARIAGAADPEFAAWLRDTRSRRQVPHRLEKCGYVQVRNDDAADGLWKLNGKRQAIYSRKELSLADRFRCARALNDGERPAPPWS